MRQVVELEAGLAGKKGEMVVVVVEGDSWRREGGA